MKRTHVIRAVAVAAVAVGIAIPATSAIGAGTLTGAGSTLVQPLVQQVFGPDFQKSSGNGVQYFGVGSGAGINQITARSVDFGASDAPMTASQAKSCGCDEVPWALSATGPAFNLPGVKALNVSGPVLADMYLGTITMWNDPKIQAINKGVSLPAMKIVPVYRSDSSGDTYAFTNFLYHASSDWRGKGLTFATTMNTSVVTGTGAPKNAGVAGIIKATPGAIGYVSTFYVRLNGLVEASVENLAGKFVYPYIQDIAAAAALVTKITPNSAITIVNPAWTPPKKGVKKLTATEKLEQIAYPIATYTYAIVPTNPKQADLLKQFLTFAITPAEEAKGNTLVFAALPKAVVTADTQTINGL